jgi:hypothetical protein
VACLVAQIRFLLSTWQPRELKSLAQRLADHRTWMQLGLGVFLVYLAALAIGPLPSMGWGFLAAVALWCTLVLLPLVAPPNVLEGWRRWSQNRRPRLLAWLVYVSSIALVASEAGLEAVRHLQSSGWLRANSSPATIVQPTALAAVARQNDQPFRIALVGDQASLGSHLTRVWLDELEEMLPGVEIAAAPLPEAWWSEGARSRAFSAIMRADLALAVVSACEDLTHESSARNWFDWRQLELARCLLGSSPNCQPQSDDRPVAADFETFLRGLGPQLAACRSPIGDELRTRWQRTYVSLDHLLAACREQRVPLAMLVVPGQFQVNRSLCETLGRRAGYPSEQLDLDLPQRRLAGFAAERQVPLLDLLPHLRLASEPLYERNASAWNEAGHRLAAKTVGVWLETSYGNQPAVATRLSRAR